MLLAKFWHARNLTNEICEMWNKGKIILGCTKKNNTSTTASERSAAKTTEGGDTVPLKSDIWLDEDK